MNLSTHTLTLAALASSLVAQQTKVLPKGADFVEGPLVLTAPFGSTQYGVQMLIDGPEVGNGSSVITGIAFRPSQVTSTQTNTSFVRNYQVTLYTVAMTASGLESSPTPYDPNNVIAGATPTVCFSGPLTLPANAPAQITPQAFTIQIPFATPYLFDSTQGNLLVMVETTDTAAAPATLRIDAINLRDDQITGLVAPIDTTGCTVLGTSLTSSTTATSVILGSSVQTQLTMNPPGAFVAALATIGFERGDVDLSVLGLTGCTLRWTGATWFDQIVIASGGAFPVVTWGIPNDVALIGAAGITQTLALPPSGLLANSVVSNAEALRVGEPGFPLPRMMCGTHTVTGTTNGWFHGVAGQFTPVIQLQGVFP